LTGKRAAEHAQQTLDAVHKAAETIGCAQLALAVNAAELLDKQRDLKKLLASGGTLPNVGGSGMATNISQEAPKPAAAKAILAEVAKLLSVSPLNVPERLAAIQEDVFHLQERLAQRAAAGPITAESLLEKAIQVGDVTVIVAEAPTVESNLMRQLIDQIRQKVGLSAVLLASSEGDDKVTLVAGVSKELQARGGHAGNWIKPVAQALGGGGGGRPDLAQAGGKEPKRLPEALEVARKTIAEMIGA
jgi:alanyl-tRNA synthetase